MWCLAVANLFRLPWHGKVHGHFRRGYWPELLQRMWQSVATKETEHHLPQLRRARQSQRGAHLPQAVLSFLEGGQRSADRSRLSRDNSIEATDQYRWTPIRAREGILAGAAAPPPFSDPPVFQWSRRACLKTPKGMSHTPHSGSADTCCRYPSIGPGCRAIHRRGI